MTNLTLSLDEAIVRSARMRAISEGTSVSAKVREFLQDYVDGKSGSKEALQAAASARLMDALRLAGSESLTSEPPPAAGKTLRDGLYGGDFRAQARTVQSA